MSGTVLPGIVVSEGMARGEALVIESGDLHVPEQSIRPDQVDRELQRFDRAVVLARKDLEKLTRDTKKKLGQMTEIIGTHLALLADEQGLLEPIRRLVREQHHGAAYAVETHVSEVAARLERMPEPLPSRVPDLIDIKRRVIGHVLGRRGGSGLEHLPRRVILIADDLTPSQTASLDKSRVLAFATDRGGPASHTAILARHLGIPALVGLGRATEKVRSGQQVIVDAQAHGRLFVDPTREQVKSYAAAKRVFTVRRGKVHLGQEGAHTKDGAQIEILGNIDSGEGGGELREMGIRSVGLFRTEFLFLGREDPPDEEAQVEHYRRLLQDMSEGAVCLRTMDFGADKMDYRVGRGREPNPFLGMRAIRLSFAHEDIFRAQLRAIVRASVAGNARVMFPLINDVGDFLKAKQALEDVHAELVAEGHELPERLPVGAMIETPAAALTARRLLKHCDFLSLGTNDLTQYTLAVDRTNPHVADLFAPHHPSVLRLIQMTVQAAREAGKPLSACGEMAGNVRYTPVLLGLGVMTLSMAARLVPDVVERIRRLRLPACRRLVENMLDARDAHEAAEMLEQFQGRPRS